MNKIGTIALMLCAVLATPLFAYWERDGVAVIIGGPGSGQGSDGDSWTWSAGANGDVDYDIGYMEAWGTIHGSAWVRLYTDDGPGHERTACGQSRVQVTTSYHWVADATSKEIFADVYATINDSDFGCTGYALNYLDTSPTTCSSRAYAQGGAEVTSICSYYPNGYTYGSANSEGGTYVDNDWWGVEATIDSAVPSQSSDTGSYSARLVVVGDISDSYSGTPWGTTFSATASLNGAVEARGKIVVQNPSYCFGGFVADASYELSGNGMVLLTGNVDDLE
jgi:hypothetical protein